LNFLRSVFVLGLYFDQANSIKKKFFLSDSRWHHFQVGCRKSRKHNFEIWQYFCIQYFAMSLYFDPQHDPNSYFAKIAKNGGSIQDGGSKSVFSPNSGSF
jgi:hypothetical protein